MAEVLGIVAAATQLGGQGLDVAMKIKSFRNQVKDAPQQVKDLLDEVATVAELVDMAERGVANDGLRVTSRSLTMVRARATELERVLEELEQSLKKKCGVKEKLRWGALKVVFKGQELASMTAKLGRAVQLLNIALAMHNL